MATSFDARFADIVQDLDFGAAATLEARRGPWILRLDGIYMKLSKDGDTPGPGFDRIDVVSKTGIVEPSVGYRLLAAPFVAIDAWVGARVWIVDNELRLSGGALEPRRLADTKAWADPIVGARLRTYLADRWFAVLLADVGGFGAASDLTWQAFAGIGYQFGEHWAAHVGYRAIGVDYHDGGFTFDVILHGPVLGLGILF